MPRKHLCNGGIHSLRPGKKNDAGSIAIQSLMKSEIGLASIPSCEKTSDCREKTVSRFVQCGMSREARGLIDNNQIRVFKENPIRGQLKLPVAGGRVFEELC